jgi:putative addiction module killer protein
MITIKQLPEFTEWLFGLKDGLTHRRLARRLEKAQNGNLGDAKPVGDGVFEMREHFGPGWRMYYVQRGERCDCDVGWVAARNHRRLPI